jgi:hypothetical protein
MCLRRRASAEGMRLRRYASAEGMCLRRRASAEGMCLRRYASAEEMYLRRYASAEEMCLPRRASAEGVGALLAGDGLRSGPKFGYLVTPDKPHFQVLLPLRGRSRASYAPTPSAEAFRATSI